MQARQDWDTCLSVRTHTKEKPSKASTITFTILPFAFLSEKILKLNGHSEYYGIYYSWWNHQMCSKMVHFNITQNLELVYRKHITYAQPIPLFLII